MHTAFNKVAFGWTEVEDPADLTPVENWIIDPVFDDPDGHKDNVGPQDWQYPGDNVIYIPTAAELDEAPEELAAAKLAKRDEVNTYRTGKLYGGYNHPHAFPITNVSTGLNGTLVVNGDYTVEFAAGTNFFVSGSTGNDGMWTVETSSYDGGTLKTTVTVTGTIPDATIDGIAVVYIMWNSTAVDIQNLNAVITLILAGAITSSVVWHDYNNINHTMNATQMITLAGGLGVFGQTCYAVSWVHKDAIDALTTISAVEAYDYATGWPS